MTLTSLWQPSPPPSNGWTRSRDDASSMSGQAQVGSPRASPAAALFWTRDVAARERRSAVTGALPARQPKLRSIVLVLADSSD
jgi:hypothetical protein